MTKEEKTQYRLSEIRTQRSVFAMKTAQQLIREGGRTANRAVLAVLDRFKRVVTIEPDLLGLAMKYVMASIFPSKRRIQRGIDAVVQVIKDNEQSDTWRIAVLGRQILLSLSMFSRSWDVREGIPSEVGNGISDKIVAGKTVRQAACGLIADYANQSESPQLIEFADMLAKVVAESKTQKTKGRSAEARRLQPPITSRATASRAQARA